MVASSLSFNAPLFATVRPRLFCFPSADRVFRTIVEQVAESMAVLTPRDLEDALRPLYPLVSVHRCELSGKFGDVWYVDRERTFPAQPSDVDGRIG